MTEQQIAEYRYSVEVPIGAGEVTRPQEPPPKATDDLWQPGDWGDIDEFGEGIPRPGWFTDDGWRRMRSGYRFDSRD